MPSPVVPSDIAAVVPSPSADICQKIKLIFLQFPALISEFWSWAFNESGTFTEEFKDAASQWTTGDFKHSAVQTQTGWLLCLSGDAEVMLADGTSKTIKEIVDRRLTADVLSYDPSSGQLGVSTITDWHKNQAVMDEWYRLKIWKGGGSGKRTLNITGNHPVWTDRGWVAVGELAKSDRIYRNEKTLTRIGREALVGIYLGDGTVDKRGQFSTSHTTPQKEYAEFIADKLGVNLTQVTGANGFTNKAYTRHDVRFSLKTFCPDLIPMMKRGVQCLELLLKELTPISLAHWYMDNGSLSKDRRSNYVAARLHTERMTDAEMTVLVEYFNKQWGIKASVWPRRYKKFPGTGSTLGISAEGSRKLFGLISPYVLPSMRYKLPEAYRDVPFCLSDAPYVGMGLVPFQFSRQRLTDLKRSDVVAHTFKYDIRTDPDHSFIANGFIVHNCNGQEVSRTTYARLFAVIGTTYGTGDGSTTFTLPDFQDRVLLGVSATKGLGWEDGVETVTLTTAQIPSHTHTIAANLYGVIPAGVIDSKPHAAGPQTSGATGGGQSHTNMQPSAAAYILVKT